MSKEVVAAGARKIMDTRIHRLRTLPYAELIGYLEPVALEVRAPSGRIFQIEIEAVWDDRKRQHLRVLVYMDDGTGMRLKPFLGSDFIVAPDGRFIGEQPRLATEHVRIRSDHLPGDQAERNVATAGNSHELMDGSAGNSFINGLAGWEEGSVDGGLTWSRPWRAPSPPLLRLRR